MRTIRLGIRLTTIAGMVPTGCNLADIGTDHAYLPVALLEEDRIQSAVALDIGDGPLAHARRTLEEAERAVREKCELRLSDGFTALQAGEADCAVIAGMGGALTVRILTAQDVKALGIKTLILSPQSEPETVRACLREIGFTIADEAMAAEDGKFYPVILAREGAQEETGSDTGLHERIRLRYGPILLEKRDAVLRAFLEREVHRLQQAITAASRGTDTERLRALEQERDDAIEALQYTGGRNAV